MIRRKIKGSVGFVCLTWYRAFSVLLCVIQPITPNILSGPPCASWMGCLAANRLGMILRILLISQGGSYQVIILSTSELTSLENILYAPFRCTTEIVMLALCVHSHTQSGCLNYQHGCADQSEVHKVLLN